MAYEDNVLIKLHRQYSKDEVVAHCIKVARESKVEVGKLKAHISELEHKLNLKNIQLKNANKELASKRLEHSKSVLKSNLKEANQANEVLKYENSRLREIINKLKNEQ